MKKRYHISDLLSITTDCLVSERHMDGVYDILNHMTNDKLWTHQLTRAARECAPDLLRQFPELQKAGTGEETELLRSMIETAKIESDAEDAAAKAAEEWISGLKKKYGLSETYYVEQLHAGEHEVKNPLDEAVELVGAAKVIAAIIPEEKSSAHIGQGDIR